MPFSASQKTLAVLLAFLPLGCDDAADEPTTFDGGVDAAVGLDSLSGSPVDAKADVSPGRQAVTISFAARVGAMPFACSSSYEGLGVDGSSVKPSDLRFYVQDLSLIDDKGKVVPVVLDADGRWQQPTVGMLDFEDKKDNCSNGTEQTNDRLVGSVPAGQYKGLRFSIGVPFELNHRPLTTSKAPLDATALFWGWNLGHIFFKAEASALVTATITLPDAGPVGGGGHMAAETSDGGHMAPMYGDAGVSDASTGPRRNLFAVHMGSVLCDGKATEGALVDCKHPNRGLIELSDFDPSKNRVVVDFAEIFKESRLQSLPGCHSFAGGETCVAPFDRVGVDWITGRPTPSTQKVFRSE